MMEVWRAFLIVIGLNFYFLPTDKDEIWQYLLGSILLFSGLAKLGG
jgi:hypothetical protein